MRGSARQESPVISRPGVFQKKLLNAPVFAWIMLCSSAFIARAVDAEMYVNDEVPATVRDADQAFISLEGNASLLSDLFGKSLFSGTVSYSLRGGYRWSGWGVFAQIEHNMWHAMEFENELDLGALNVGVGGEYIYASGLIRSSLAIGPSVLLADTPLDRAGSVGLFLDIRPAGFRFHAHDHLAIGFDPITFSIVAPSLKGIPLFRVIYRTNLYLEAVF
jgi:hypothetical protein